MSRGSKPYKYVLFPFNKSTVGEFPSCFRSKKFLVQGVMSSCVFTTTNSASY
jgi:hypothetical protein